MQLFCGSTQEGYFSKSKQEFPLTLFNQTNHLIFYKFILHIHRIVLHNFAFLISVLKKSDTKLREHEKHAKAFFWSYFTEYLVFSDKSYVCWPQNHPNWRKQWFLDLSKVLFHQIQPCNMSKLVSVYHFRLNMFDGIFLHETTFSNVKLVSLI